MASVFAFEFFKQLSFDVIVMLVDFVDGFLSIFLEDFSILLEAKFRSKFAILDIELKLP